jgi:hypothetical protein
MRNSLAHVLRHLRYALRQLRNSAAFSIVAVTTLAIAIGANAAMFSIAKGLLLSPLPYPEPDGIVRILERRPNGGLNGISPLNYLDWAAENSVFEYIAAEAAWSATLTGGDEPIFIQGARASAHYFDIFGADRKFKALLFSRQCAEWALCQQRSPTERVANRADDGAAARSGVPSRSSGC